MPIKPCSLNIDAYQHEKDNRGTPMFPCGGYKVSVKDHTAHKLPWHWHEEIELVVVCKGTLILDFLGQSVRLEQGDGVFINTSVLHAFSNPTQIPDLIKSFVFHPNIIYGMVGSSFEQRYVRPLMNCTQLPIIHFCKEIPWHMAAIQYILDAFAEYEIESFGYEFIVRENLSKLWLLLVTNQQKILQEQQLSNNVDSSRLKIMLKFIHSNYMNRLSLQDIAATAAISPRECLRCFNRAIRISPMQYLSHYRISIATDLLINSNMSITEICKKTGFDSPSYFSLSFKKLIEYTPKDYRKIHTSPPL